MRQVPVHCNDCTWFYSKMGACPHPDVSMFYSYVSFLPYMIIFYLIGLTLIKRQLSIIRLTSMLVTAYIVGDKLLKNVFQSHRPPFSCKNTYGMPSSHMTVMVAVTVFVLMKKETNNFVKLGMVALCILQGIARVWLHYHTYEQVFGGVLFGTGFTLVFFKLFNLLWPKVKQFLPTFLNIQDDLFLEKQLKKE